MANPNKRLTDYREGIARNTADTDILQSKSLHRGVQERFEEEFLIYFRLGVDGVFTDFPDLGHKARSNFKPQ